MKNFIIGVIVGVTLMVLMNRIFLQKTNLNPLLTNQIETEVKRPDQITFALLLEK